MAHTIRPARPADASVLAGIDSSVNLNPWSEQQFATACSGLEGARDSALIAQEEGRVDGFVVISQIMDEASILSLAVRPTRQRQGLGRMLLRAALERMAQTGAARCLLEVRQSNIAARRLYKRSGFVMDGVRKNYYPTENAREDALLLSCEIEGYANERA